MAARSYFNKVKQYYRALLLDSKVYLRLVTRGFVLGFAMGILAVLVNQQAVLAVIQEALKSIQELAEEAIELDFVGIFGLIWQNNILVTGMMIFFGFLLGYVPLVAVWGNGAVLGALFILFTRESIGQGLLFGVTVLPHGVLEIPAFLIAAAFGIKLGWAWLLPAAKGKRLQVLNQIVYECLAIYGAVILLLAIAALIEAFWMVHLI
ncbi:MAG TPA: stage II sporulation protein M [Candidatus Wirthbacteria bacterium]|nr:stage II sporulation protein M [Candidatus Wirthbacteria bacterium]